MIDQSPPGSWAAILPYCTQITILDDYEAELERRLAARRAARAISCPHARGHVTRAINAEAVQC